MLAAMLLSLASLLSAPPEKVQAAESSSYKVVGYYPSWGAYGRGYNVSDIDGSKLTHINYAFADICWNGIHGNPDPTGPNTATWSCQDEAGVINVPNGTIVLGDPWIDAQKAYPGDTWDQPLRGNINQLNKLKLANPQLKTIISVGGWTWSNRFSDVAATAANRLVFAKSAVSFLRHYGFDGVDLDWEYPVGGGLAGNSVRPEDKRNYTLLLQDIRKELDAAELTDGKEYLLTIASGASPSYVTNTELGQIAATVDWINIMSYDFSGGWSKLSAHNAPLYQDPAAIQAGVEGAETFHVAGGVQGHLNAGVPASKLVMGLPFYGRGWSGCVPGAEGDGQYENCTGLPAGTWEAGVFDYGDLISKYVNKNGFTRYWNDTAKVPYLYNASSKVYISYDDLESMDYKLQYLKAKGLGGGMFWELSSDCRVSSNYSCSGPKLLDKVAADLLGGGNVPPADTIAPTVPGSLTVTGKTQNTVSLGWNASTDNKAVTSYNVYRGGVLAATSTGTTAIVSGLTAGTSYTFTVKAKDAAGNESAASTAVTVVTDTTTNPPADTIAPTVPANVSIASKTASSVSLSWAASSDNVGVTGYEVYNGSSLAASVSGITATVNGLTAGTSYTFTVKAKDAAGNRSAASTPVNVTTDAAGGCTAAAWSSTSVYTGGNRASYNGLVYEAKWWTQGDRPDLSGVDGVWKVIGTCDGGGTGGTDSIAPSAPSGLAASAQGSSSFQLGWSAAADNVGVTSYMIYNGSTLTAEVSGTSAIISGLTAGYAYSFTVKAKDAAGNVSAASTPLIVTLSSDPGSGGDGAAAWAVGKAYRVNDLVTYTGKTYKCLQAHTSLNGWEPAAAASLWQLQP